ncbi:hypothetical protein BDA99DRAFT_530614 [Phascolomyces articulosus]|uniref:Uncharacterized protein n=1 Tax=Phascolomyces articulosus TaxID=60185 RepID=A0AAD5P6U7_9FUNG|nr:hypothetical protein BDA99DRAFT_530614 [Phascolomyces articulosus]
MKGEEIFGLIVAGITGLTFICVSLVCCHAVYTSYTKKVPHIRFIPRWMYKYCIPREYVRYVRRRPGVLSDKEHPQLLCVCNSSICLFQIKNLSSRILDTCCCCFYCQQRDYEQDEDNHGGTTQPSALDKSITMENGHDDGCDNSNHSDDNKYDTRSRLLSSKKPQQKQYPKQELMTAIATSSTTQESSRPSTGTPAPMVNDDIRIAMEYINLTSSAEASSSRDNNNS